MGTNFKFNFQGVNELSGVELANLIAKQANVGGSKGHAEAIESCMTTSVLELAHLMILKGGKFDDELFYKTCESLKNDINNILDSFRNFEEKITDPEVRKALSTIAGLSIDFFK